ncbi:hypothetical protein ATKI12_5781 [Kitasatospora sp. Ki12]
MRKITTDDGHVITVRHLADGTLDVQLHNPAGETTATASIPCGQHGRAARSTAVRISALALAALLLRGPRGANT